MTTIYQSNIDENLNPINASHAFDSMSSKYNRVDSNNLIEIFQDHGLSHTATSFGKPRKLEKRGFQKHVMIFEGDNMQIDDQNKLQLLATNSHDGTSSLILNIGVFRAVCANGLVSGDSIFEYKVKHIGNDFQNRVNEIISHVLNAMPQVASQVESMKNTKLEMEQIREFKKYASDLRLEKVNGLYQVIESTIARPRRQADLSDDLYTVFNRIQENVIKGGIKYSTRVLQENDTLKHTNNTTRQVKAISELQKLNKGLWNHATDLLVA